MVAILIHNTLHSYLKYQLLNIKIRYHWPRLNVYDVIIIDWFTRSRCLEITRYNYIDRWGFATLYKKTGRTTWCRWVPLKDLEEERRSSSRSSRNKKANTNPRLYPSSRTSTETLSTKQYTSQMARSEPVHSRPAW